MYEIIGFFVWLAAGVIFLFVFMVGVNRQMQKHADHERGTSEQRGESKNRSE